MHGNQRQQRGGGRNGGDFQDQYQERAPRAPLQWQEVKRLTDGKLVATVTAARNDRGDMMHSFEIFKEGREPGQKKKHYDARDLGAIRSLLVQIEDFLNVGAVEA